MVVSVEDDGKGFDPESLQRAEVHGFGVRTMRERITKAGGRLEIRSMPGEGTVVRISLPLQQEVGDEGTAD